MSWAPPAIRRHRASPQDTRLTPLTYEAARERIDAGWTPRLF